MNAGDFVIIPGNKPGVSTKLKSRNLKELRLETVQLELDNQEMEQRLLQLRHSMSREKQERERSGGYHWKSGQAGTLNNPVNVLQSKDSSIEKVSSGKVKIKTLKGQPEVLPKQSSVSATFVSNSRKPKPKPKGKPCGQCEVKGTAVVCLECGEDYCASCFAQIHQKGALKLHRTVPFSGEARPVFGSLEVVKRFKQQVNLETESNCKDAEAGEKTFGKTSGSHLKAPADINIISHDNYTKFKPSVPQNEKCGSLLHGTFDEEESSKSFQKVLEEWRTRDHKAEWRHYEAEPVSVGISVVQTNMSSLKEPVEIHFREHGLNYMEKLLLKKHRRTPLDPIPTPRLNNPVSSFSPYASPDTADFEDPELTAEEMEEHERCTALFAVDDSTYKDRLSEPSVKITELDETGDWGSEELTSCIVEEVDSSDSETEQRFTPGQHSITVSSAKKSNALPVLASKKHRQFPLRSTFVVNVEGSVEVSSHPTRTLHNEQQILKERCSPIETKLLLESQLHTPRRQNSRPKICLDQHKSIAEERNFSCFPAERRAAVLSTKCKNDFQSTESSESMQRSVDSFHSQDSASMGLTMKASTELYEVAQKISGGLSQYHGLEGFFIMGLESKQVLPDPFPARTSHENIKESGILLTGDGQWRPNSSLSECAQDSLVNTVLNEVQSRPSSSLGNQNMTPRFRAFSVSSAGNAITTPRSISRNMHCSSPYGYSSRYQSVPQTSGPSSAAVRPLSRATVEISEIELVDLFDTDHHQYEDVADQETLAGLEEELKILKNQNGSYSKLPRTDEMASDFHHVTGAVRNMAVSASSSRNTRQSHTVRSSLKSWDGKGQTDNEEDIWDKQTILLLP
ncbi:zinc finger B-box domain-containing protein 1 [Protopterus annectens]|uniref:zinc finger B-box domain-containing protein 1 n=1 Tax=Protopterus annectens TaxID=7888 RepID=UPI001CF99656|nr:zinc finger B-box domain-containing protein 1 [Protopterus annectens]XP_043925932.1 zinc finger B-box domain-containing protein 1 [Protopterus annectens]